MRHSISRSFAGAFIDGMLITSLLVCVAASIFLAWTNLTPTMASVSTSALLLLLAIRDLLADIITELRSK